MKLLILITISIFSLNVFSADESVAESVATSQAKEVGQQSGTPCVFGPQGTRVAAAKPNNDIGKQEQALKIESVTK